MIKYKTDSSRWSVRAVITPVEVERETETSVWVKGRRRSRVTGWDIYHDTWEDAHAHLTAESQRHVDAARRKLEEAKSYQGNVKGLKKPDTPAP